MADTKTWTLAEQRTLFRQLTGRPSTDQISDEDVNKEINDYFVNFFSHDAKVDEFNVFFTQALSATDTGIYSLGQNIDRLDDPVTINGAQITLERDREVFFGERHHHRHRFAHFDGSRTTLGHGDTLKGEQFITDPGLAIGTSDSSKVKHDAFDYEIQNRSYSKATSEVVLTGDAVPAGKFGAWSFRIDEDGDITVSSANDNVTGYLTPRIALDALTSSDSESAYMGYVTVIKSDGAFTPGTTTLDAANVTDTFTDGKFELRAEPISCLLFGQNIYVKPKPNDIYELEAISVADRPTAFQNDADTPDDAKWGPAIAARSAEIFMRRLGEDETVVNVASQAQSYMAAIRSDKIKRLLGQVIVRSS